MQDYKVMVHKGLGSDKAVCGSESGDFRSTGFGFFSPPPSLTKGGGDSKHRQVPSDGSSLTIGRLSLAGSSLFCFSLQPFQRRTPGQGRKNTAAHESRSLQPLARRAVSHARCLQRPDDFKTAHYGLLSRQSRLSFSIL